MSGRTWPARTRVRHRDTGEHGVVLRQDADLPVMVVDTSSGPVTVIGEATWDWDDLSGPG